MFRWLRRKRPQYEQAVPRRVQALAQGVGLPKPNWYEGASIKGEGR